MEASCCHDVNLRTQKILSTSTHHHNNPLPSSEVARVNRLQGIVLSIRIVCGYMDLPIFLLLLIGYLCIISLLQCYFLCHVFMIFISLLCVLFRVMNYVFFFVCVFDVSVYFHFCILFVRILL